MKKTLVIVLICLLPKIVFAVDYFVDASASGANNGTSLANAWESFADINWATVDSGNGTLWVCGSHHETMTIGAHGESVTPIIIDGDCSTQGGTDGTIDGDSTRTEGIFVNDSYITIRNLTFQEIRASCIDGDGSQDLVVEYNTFTANPTSISGQNVSVRCNSCDDPTFQYNTVDIPDRASGQTDGIFFQNITGTANIIGNSIVIENSSSNHNDCLQIEPGTADTNVIGNYCDQSSHNKTSDAQGIFYAFSNGGTHTIQNNVCIFNRSPQAVSIFSTSSASTFNIYNNTVIQADAQSATYQIYWFHDNSSNSTWNVKNNICDNPAGPNPVRCYNYQEASGATINHDYNLTYCPNASQCWDDSTFSGWQSSGYDTNGDNSDPSLDANARPDDSGDPSVGAGVNLGAAYDDGLSIDMTLATWISAFTFVDRDNTGAATWDIGAFEYTEAGGDATPPAVTIDQTSPQNIGTDSLEVTGNCTDAAGTIGAAKCRIDAEPDASNGTACTADDASFDEASEDWTCTITGFSDGGSNTLYCECDDDSDNWQTGNSITVNYDSTPPEPPVIDGNVVVPAGGATMDINFTEIMVTTGYDNGDFVLICSSAGSVSLNNITGSGSVRSFELASTINSQDVCTLSYTGDADEVENTAGTDLAQFTGWPVDNRSTQGQTSTATGLGIVPVGVSMQ